MSQVRLVFAIFLFALGASASSAQTGSPGQEAFPSLVDAAPLPNGLVRILTTDGRTGLVRLDESRQPVEWGVESQVRQEVLPGLVTAPGNGVIFASNTELSQAFDTDGNGSHDFFQALVRSWPGVESGVFITAPPIADRHGRVLIALSPHAQTPGQAPLASIVAWTPGQDQVVPVMVSELPVISMSADKELFVALLDMPSYRAGYYVSLTGLPAPPDSASSSPGDSPNPEAPPAPVGAPSSTRIDDTSSTEAEAAPAPDPGEESEVEAEETPAPPPLPQTLPSLIIPAEMTGNHPPSSIRIVRENGRRKIIACSPHTSRLIEILPERNEEVWQGVIFLRSETAEPVVSVLQLADGSILGAGPAGLIPTANVKPVFRLEEARLVDDGIELRFNHPVDRSAGILPETYSVESVPLRGGGGTAITIPEPLVEPDGFGVILRTTQLEPATVVRLKFPGLVSERGDALLNATVYYAVNRLP